MLAPPFMDHRMTLELGIMKPTTKPTHGKGSNTAAPATGSGKGSRDELFPQDTAHAGHTLRSISDSAGRWSQKPGAPKRTLSV